MLRDFKLEIDNYGPINNAELNISKINVVAGKNASGKTTLSKLIYCIITTFSNDGQQLTYDSLKDQILMLVNNLQLALMAPLPELGEIIHNVENDNKYKIKTIERGYKKLEKIIKSLPIENKEILLDAVKKEKKGIKKLQSKGFHSHLLINLIRNEFSGAEQLTNYNMGKFSISNDKQKFRYDVEITNDITVESPDNYKNKVTANREAIYIETPYFLDYKIPFSQVNYYGQKQYHQILLFQKLTDQSSKNDILDEIHNKHIIEFENKINELLKGKFNFNNMGLLEFKKDDKTFDLPNTSTGLKSVGILQLLLENRKLKENSCLIMDEPEVHLHPEWQIKLANILVLLAKELNVTLFINTHSPLFIEAIRTYSEKYELLDDTNFYLTYPAKDNEGKFNIKNVATEDLNIIYNSLGKVYETLSEISIENQFK